MSNDFDYPWAYGRERGARKWLTLRLREIARSYNPEPGAPGNEIEGRVIASDLFMIAQMVEDGMADLDAQAQA